MIIIHHYETLYNKDQPCTVKERRCAALEPRPPIWTGKGSLFPVYQPIIEEALQEEDAAPAFAPFIIVDTVLESLDEKVKVKFPIGHDS